MSLPPPAEATSVEKAPRAARATAKAKPKPKSTPKTAAPRKRTAATRPAPPAPAPAPAPPVVARKLPRGRAVLVIVSCVAAVAAILVAVRWDGSTGGSGEPASAVSAQELASFAAAHASPVYWAGELRDRTLELTETTTGTFVRYLPAGVDPGSAEQTLTIATYPMRDAYASAVARAAERGTSSRRTPDGGLAVWNDAQPTSVYVAWRGVPSLVEVYAPRAAEARSTAVGGRVRPVR